MQQHDHKYFSCRLPHDPGGQKVSKHGHDAYQNKGNSQCSNLVGNILLKYIIKKMLLIKTGTHKVLVRIANREDPDQTASSEAD